MRVLYVGGENRFSAQMMSFLASVDGVEAYRIGKEQLPTHVIEQKPDLLLLDWDYAPEKLELLRSSNDVSLAGCRVWVIGYDSPYEIHAKAAKSSRIFNKGDHVFPELLRTSLRGLAENLEVFRRQHEEVQGAGCKIFESFPPRPPGFEP